MNNEEPRQGWPAPPGHAPNGGYDGYGGYGPQAPPAPARQSAHRGAWIGAGATLVAAVIGVVGTYMVSGNNNPAPTPPAAQGPTASTTPPGEEAQGGDEASPDSSRSPETVASSKPSSQAPTAQVPPAKPADTVEWQGALAIAYAEDKDLDSAPPAESEINEENDFSVYPFGTTRMLRPESGAKALVWKDSTAPSYEDCAGAVDTLGTTTDMKMKTGLVVCARTNDGRLARLTVKEAAGQGSETRGVFDVVVWSG
ncbi:hypothetical protein [Streptomyces sp. NPDC002057]|uniref:hypothetical protein n=1 Tax=Streptomyces sp. NPDC002057 TaxID=3154664 RepID=UPI00332EC936